MSTVIVYHEPQPVAPDSYPCVSCRVHGPYCGDSCPLLDAWREAQAKQKEPRDGQ